MRRPTRARPSCLGAALFALGFLVATIASPVLILGRVQDTLPMSKEVDRIWEGDLAWVAERYSAEDWETPRPGRWVLVFDDFWMRRWYAQDSGEDEMEIVRSMGPPDGEWVDVHVSP